MMIHRSLRFASFLLISAAALLAAAASPAPVTYAPAPSEVWVEGTSTLHDWRVEGAEIRGEIRVDPELLLAADSPSLEETAARVRVPIKGLESGKSKMDALMYEALEAEDHPFIEYELDEVRRLSRQDGSALFEAKGRLTVAGETRPLTLRVTAKIVTGGGLLVEGSTPLRMTEFGIEPPKAMLGSIKTGDEVRVGFRWTLNPKASAGRG